MLASSYTIWHFNKFTNIQPKFVKRFIEKVNERICAYCKFNNQDKFNLCCLNLDKIQSKLSKEIARISEARSLVMKNRNMYIEPVGVRKLHLSILI